MASSSSSGAGYRERIIASSSTIWTPGIMPPSWSIAPTLAWATADPGFEPKTSMLPASGTDSPRSMEMVVVLPAPLGPSSATVSPWPTREAEVVDGEHIAEPAADPVEADRGCTAVHRALRSHNGSACCEGVMCHSLSVRRGGLCR